VDLPRTDVESLRALRRAIELGPQFIDTALATATAHASALVRKVLAEHPGTVMFATKGPPRTGFGARAASGIPI